MVYRVLRPAWQLSLTHKLGAPEDAKRTRITVQVGGIAYWTDFTIAEKASERYVAYFIHEQFRVVVRFSVQSLPSPQA